MAVRPSFGTELIATSNPPDCMHPPPTSKPNHHLDLKSSHPPDCHQVNPLTKLHAGSPTRQTAYKFTPHQTTCTCKSTHSQITHLTMCKSTLLPDWLQVIPTTRLLSSQLTYQTAIKLTHKANHPIGRAQVNPITNHPTDNLQVNHPTR